jgi:hypothetical protein
VLFVAANAGICLVVAHQEPLQLAYAFAALLVLTAAYPRGRAATRPGVQTGALREP